MKKDLKKQLEKQKENTFSLLKKLFLKIY